MYNLINYVAEAGIATLTLNDPPVNAYTHEMMKELDEAILEARFDSDVQIIVLTGHGEQAFCTGANVPMLREVDPVFKYYFCLHTHETLLRLEQTPKLVVAAINGHCLGGGLELALACDLRLARRGAGKLGMPEQSLGALPGAGGTQRLTRLLGKSRALQMMLEGETTEFEQGLELGLLNRLFDAPSAEAFLETVLGYVRRFTSPHRSPLAVGRLKRSVQAASEMSLEQGLAFERELGAQLLGTDDAREGLAAYSERRAPSFKGR